MGCHYQKSIFLDIILKDKYDFLFAVMGILNSDEEDNIKKKLVELISKLLLKDNDKNSYFNCFPVISFL